MVVQRSVPFGRYCLLFLLWHHRRQTTASATKIVSSIWYWTSCTLGWTYGGTCQTIGWPMIHASVRFIALTYQQPVWCRTHETWRWWLPHKNWFVVRTLVGLKCKYVECVRWFFGPFGNNSMILVNCCFVTSIDIYNQSSYLVQNRFESDVTWLLVFK